MKKFRNPYNFIPLSDPKPDGLLGQRRPVGHDRYHDELWSGRIEVRIATATPLLIPDAGNVQKGANDHKTFDLRRDAQGRPLLPETTLKGALRAAYEAVTNSRLGVFRGHEAPPARRMAGIEGAAMVPARIVEDGDGFAVELWKGTSRGWPELQTARSGNKFYAVKDGNRVESVFAAWLPRYEKKKPGPARWAATKSGSKSLPVHGEEVFCWVEAYRHEGRNFRYWRVNEIASDAALLSSKPKPTPGFGRHMPVNPSDFREARGFVFVSEQNTENKHDERVFFVEEGETPLTVVLSKDEQAALSKQWTWLIENYQKLHESEIAERGGPSRAAVFVAPKPGKTAFSRHVFTKGAKALARGTPFDPAQATSKVGTLCYARLVMRNGRLLLDKAGRPRIEGLYPVMISRELGHVSPEELLPKDLRPAARLEQLSPADRVFGWVNQNGHGAYKGQVRIHSVECQSGDAIEEFGPRGLPLAILGAPKPAQARFYLGDKDGKPLPERFDPATQGYFEKVATGKEPESRLRGRKVYPHHAAAARVEDYWDKQAAKADAGASPRPGGPEPAGTVEGRPLWREYVRRPEQAGEPNGSRDSQNRSIRAWVKPGTAFTAVIDVINLNVAELGALLWLLDMARLEGGNGVPVPHHRLGGGKPLGFGSVTIAVAGVDLATGAARRQRYASLLSRPEVPAGIPERLAQGLACPGAGGTDGAGQLVDALVGKAEAECGRPFRDLPQAAAFLQAARGHADALPTHYPRVTAHPDPAGENFRWFGDHRQQSLPDIHDKEGLPIPD